MIYSVSVSHYQRVIRLSQPLRAIAVTPHRLGLEVEAINRTIDVATEDAISVRASVINSDVFVQSDV